MTSVLTLILCLSNLYVVFVRCQTLSSRHFSFDSQVTLSPRDSTYQSNPIQGFIPSPSSNLAPSITLKAKPTTVYRPRSLEALHRARLRSLYHQESEDVEWDRIEILGPDVENKHTLSQLARMSANAYAVPGQKNWYEIDDAWNTVCCAYLIGTNVTDEKPYMGGRAFHSAGKKTKDFVDMSSYRPIIPQSSSLSRGLCYKGRLLKWTNLMIICEVVRYHMINILMASRLFSCCCARVDFSWTFRTVCDCYSHNWRCDNTCLTKALTQDSLFYSVGVVSEVLSSW